MKTKQLFWGVLLIALGVLIFLNNSVQLNWEWEQLIKLWPVFFILWGISLMIKNAAVKGIVISLVALIFAVSIFASFKTFFNLADDAVWDNGEITFSDTETLNDYSEPFNSNINNANFNFHAGAGAIRISDTTSQLINAKTQGYKDNFDLSVTNFDDETDVDFEMTKTRFSFKGINSKNKIDVKLNPNPIWDFNIHVGAASLDLDLSKFKIENAKIEMGAASLHTKIGDLADKVDFEIDAGASSINILIPENSGCEINADVTLSSKDFEGFKKINSSLYKTENFENAAKKIYLKIDSGVSSIKVSRYKLNEIW